FRIVTRFPFGFLRKARRLSLQTEALVYPSVEPTADYLEILPGLQGALESVTKGRGQDLYALRDYLPTDSARHVHWKASARSGSLMVREFTREDDCRILLVLDPHLSAEESSSLKPGVSRMSERFERAVTICASLAWHFTKAIRCYNSGAPVWKLLLLPPMRSFSQFSSTWRSRNLCHATRGNRSWPISRLRPNFSKSSSPASPTAPSRPPCGVRLTSSSSTIRP